MNKSGFVQTLPVAGLLGTAIATTSTSEPLGPPLPSSGFPALTRPGSTGHRDVTATQEQEAAALALARHSGRRQGPRGGRGRL
jgi:hypothetical protein